MSDRGANIKMKAAVRDFGLDHFKTHKHIKGLKVIPRPDLGPTIVELKKVGDRIELVHAFPLKTPSGRPLTGLPLPGAVEAGMEPAFSLDGAPLDPDPCGADTEAIAALSDGTFLVAEEYGPSVMKVAADGTVTARWTPHGSTLQTDPPATACLPAMAGRRRQNRGLEAMAVSPDEKRLHLVLQSPIEGETRLRFWTVDIETGVLVAEHFYDFDNHNFFARDAAAGEVFADDLKVCEIACLGEGVLLVLERISATAKIYRVDLNAGPDLQKTLLFNTDYAPEVAPDLEGMAITSDRSLLLVTDNDFGTEGVATRFYEIVFNAPFAKAYPLSIADPATAPPFSQTPGSPN